MRTRSTHGFVALAVAAGWIASACGGGSAVSGLAQAPTAEGAPAKCGVAGKGRMRPLVVEWPSADRSELEALTHRGPIVVRYAGCEIDVLDTCRAIGAYAYVPTTIQQDKVEMKDADQLYANLPVGAPKLEALLRKGGQLVVSMTIVGRFEADGDGAFARARLTGDCDNATHVVRAMAVGAFEFYQEGEAKASADALGLAGGKSESKRSSLNAAGDAARCREEQKASPPFECGAALRIELEPIASP
jgi:hypothetical protein